MKSKEKEELLKLLEARDNQYKYRKFYTYFFQDYMIDPITGQDISRSKYDKILQFFKAGATYKERALIAPNRTGKSEAGSFEMTCHLTKDYPSWWEGKRFTNKPCTFVFVGKEYLAVRNVIQAKLLGPKKEIGTGLLPHRQFNNGVGVDEKLVTAKTGVSGAALDIFVYDIYGNLNQLVLVSREQDPAVIEGMTLDAIWFDEDKEDADGRWYGEAYARTITTNGILWSTYTPWPDGMTHSVMNFLPEREFPKDGIVRDDKGEATNKFVVGLSLDDAHHMTEEMKEDQRIKYVGREYDARVLGIPPLGAGSIYPVSLKDIVVENFPIPEHWPIAYGLDYGWNETAVVWVAKDPQTSVYYVYGEYAKGQVTPYIHVEAIKNGGDPDGGAWIQGIDDPSGGFSIKDGSLMRDEFRNLGLNLNPGVNSLQAGITRTLTLLESGRLKIMDNCRHLQKEYSLYRYDDLGKVARNQDDHALDALRYCLSRFDYIASSKADKFEEDFNIEFRQHSFNSNGRDKLTGY